MKKRRKSDYLETMSWEDMFYIIDLNDSEQPYRKGYSVEKDGHWYNLCLRPNTIRNISRHYCLACGSNLKNILRCVGLNVSRYRDIYTMYEAMNSITDGCKCGRVSLEQKDEWWNEYGDTEYVTMYDKQIKEAIEVGKKTFIYSGPNVKVTYNEENDESDISGMQSEWFIDLVDKFMSFKGHTKVELLDALSDDMDVYCLNEVFAKLKAIGCRGIKQMKKLNMYRWFDVLAPLTNSWEFDTDYDYYSINED